MKTKNNIQKTTLQTLSAAIIIAILGFTVNAQESFKSFFETDGINHFAMAMGKAEGHTANGLNNSFTKAETFNAYLINETEEPMNVEAWMTNENTFDGTTVSIETETESELTVEDWMTDENSFTPAINVETETENPLEVEGWMMNENNYNSFTEILETEREAELVKEDWMLNENVLGNNEQKAQINKTEAQPISTATFFYREVNKEEKLVIESWMLNSLTWGK